MANVFNRTTVECKSCHYRNGMKTLVFFNRTTVECKFGKLEETVGMSVVL